MVQWAALNGHIVPGRRSVAQSDAYLHSGRRPENMQAFVDSLSFAVPIYPHPWWQRMFAETGPLMTQFLVGTEGKRISVEEAFGGMQQKLQTVLDEYNVQAPTSE